MSALVMRMIGDSRRPATPPSPEYGSARQGGSVQKSGLCRTNSQAGRFGTEKRPLPYQQPGREVRYRKAASAVPNSTAGRFRTEKQPPPYQTARHGGSVQKSGLCRTKPHGGEVQRRKRPRPVPNRTVGQNLRRICGNLFFAAYYVEVFLINLHPRKAGT